MNFIKLVTFQKNFKQVVNKKYASLSTTSKGKLYYSPTSCGAASFIAAYNGKVNLNCEQVNLKTHKTHSGVDFYTLNPKGNVPSIIFSDGTVLNENTAVLQYIADQATIKIAPENGTMDRYILQNALSYISTEVHPSIGGLFNPSITSDTRDFIKGNALKKLSYLENTLIADKQFVLGDAVSIADSYLFIVLTWTSFVKIDLTPFPRVQAYLDRMKKSRFVKEAQAHMATNPSTVV